MEKTKAKTSQKPEELKHVKKAENDDQRLWIGTEFFTMKEGAYLNLLKSSSTQENRTLGCGFLSKNDNKEIPGSTINYST